MTDFFGGYFAFLEQVFLKNLPMVVVIVDCRLDKGLKIMRFYRFFYRLFYFQKNQMSIIYWSLHDQRLEGGLIV